MCGRFTFTEKNKSIIAKQFGLTVVPSKPKVSYNLAPSQDIPVILNETPHQLSYVKWGLVPRWSTDPKTSYRMINARCETITQKPSFKQCIVQKRCLVLADSFFEWKKMDRKKTPFRIMLEDDSLFAMAGIWETWEKGDKIIHSCAVVTTNPNRLMRCIHHRMPVILPKDKQQEYLRSDNMKDVLKMLKPCDDKYMKAYMVSDLVNSPQNNDPSVIIPAELKL